MLGQKRHLEDPLSLTRGFMVVRTDLEGRFTYANQAYLDYMGLRALPIGTSALQHVAKEDQSVVLNTVKRILANPHQSYWVEFSKPLKHAWNRSRWEFTAVVDAEGKPVGIQCTGYDISEAYRQARFQEASAELLASGLKEALSPAEVLQRTLEVAFRVVPVAQAGSATLLQPEGHFRFVAAWGYDLEALQRVVLYPQEPLSLSQHIQAKVFTQTDIARFNSRLDPERRDLLEGPGRASEIQAMLATPVVVKGVPRAYLYLDHFERADAFDETDVRHLEGLAHHVAWLLYGNELQEEVRLGRYRDPQTGLDNLHSLKEVLVESLTPKALVALHCRSLERIRRLEGEGVWAAVVRSITDLLKSELRSDDRLAFDRDLFWLLLEGVETSSEVMAVLARLQAQAQAQLASRWPQLDFNPRVGVALARPEIALHELPEAAEAALQQVRQPGGISIYEPFLRQNTLEDDWLHQALALALRPLKAGGGAPLDFFLHFQPIRRLADGQLQHLEALLRWQHPERGLISPGRFVSIVEEDGWMIELGDWILGEAVARAAQWGLPVAVNLAGSQLEPALPNRIAHHLQRHGLAPQQLALEVTEQVLLDEGRLAVLQDLARRGYSLHLDDFGTGFSSLDQIARLPLAAIKLDQGFVKSLGPNPSPGTSEARLMKAVQGLGSALGLEIIVEGIETEAQRRFLLAEGFSLGQGYLLGRPAATVLERRKA
ncbi:MAG: hypothetical protein KatS3mg073_1299 [Meiothermus sp.]|nr:Cyclic di-GMP phosphodiesterase Gmr [Meiothermus hypogaeus]GIW37154.1 MAG: hypothetical protein KatS3mg073_1299 [Meiothermus sp.]